MVEIEKTDRHPFAKLLGTKVEAVMVSPEGWYLRIDTSAGSFGFFADYDCCSESWFADLTGAEALIGHTITGITEVDLGDVADDRCRQEYDLAYGFAFTTTGGRADIVLRNSSNGYYGGWVSDDWSGAAMEKATVRVTDDWSA